MVDFKALSSFVHKTVSGHSSPCDDTSTPCVEQQRANGSSHSSEAWVTIWHVSKGLTTKQENYVCMKTSGNFKPG